MRYGLSVMNELDAWLCGAQRILIASDFDGTLCPIAESPSDVRVAPAMLEVLRRVAGSERITLAVVSGRALSDVRARLPLDITFAGNHGLEIEGSRINFVHAGALELRPRLAKACDSLDAAIKAWPGAWIEDKHLSATLHYRRVDPDQHSALLFTARRTLSAFASDFALRAGKRALEVRPKVQWDKGYALEYIREWQGPFDACICLGDDRTDEAMFRANEGHLSIRVGAGGTTIATQYLSQPTDVAILLSHVLDISQFRPQFEAAAAPASAI